MADKKTDIKDINNKIKLAFSYQDKDNWKKKTERFMDYYKGKYNDASIGSGSKYTINTVFNYVNLLVPNLYFRDPYIELKPKTKHIIRKQPDGSYLNTPSWKGASLMESVLNKELKTMKFEKEMKKCVQDALIYGFGVMKVGYGIETEIIHDNERPEEDSETEVIKEESIFAKRVCPKFFGIDPAANELSEAQYCVHKIIKPLDEVKNNPNYKNTSTIKGCLPEDLRDKVDGIENKQAEGAEYVELYEIHDLVSKKIITKAKGHDKILREVDNVYEFNGHHFVVLTFAKDNDEFVGIPMVEMIEDQAIVKNKVYSKAVNHMDIFPGQVIVEEGAMEDSQVEDMEEGGQGAILRVKNGSLQAGRVQKQGPVPMGSDYFNMIAQSQNEADNTLGIQDFQRAGSTKRQTAAEVTFIQADATIRKEYFLSYVKEFVIDVVGKVTGLIQQYYDREREIRLEGDIGIEFVKYTNEDIKGEFDFDFDINTMKFMSQAKAQQIINALNILGAHAQKVPAFAQALNSIDGDKLMTELFDSMDLNFEQFKKRPGMTHLEFDPEQENELFRAGKVVPDPMPNEPHLDHIAIHQIEYELTKNPDILRHINMHMLYDKVMKGEIPPETLAQAQSKPAGMPSQPQPQGGMNAQGIQPNAPAAPTEQEIQGGFFGNN